MPRTSPELDRSNLGEVEQAVDNQAKVRAMLARAGEERLIPLLSTESSMALMADIEQQILAGREIIAYPNYGLNVIKVEPSDLRGIYGFVSENSRLISITGVGRELLKFLGDKGNRDVRLLLIHGVAMEISPGKLPSYQRGLTYREEFSPEAYMVAAIQGTDLGHDGDIDILAIGNEGLTLEGIRSRFETQLDGRLTRARIVPSASRPGFSRIEIVMNKDLYRPTTFNTGNEVEEAAKNRIREYEFNNPFVQLAFNGDIDGIYRNLGLAYYVASRGSVPNPVMLMLGPDGNVIGARLDFFPKMANKIEEVEYTSEGRHFTVKLRPSYYCCPEMAFGSGDLIGSAAAVIRENKSCWAGSGGGVYPVAKDLPPREFMEWLAINVWRPAGKFIREELDSQRREGVLRSFRDGFQTGMRHIPEFTLIRFWDTDYSDELNKFNVYGSEMIKNIFPGLYQLLSEDKYLTRMLKELRTLPVGSYCDFRRTYAIFLRSLITRREYYVRMVEASLLMEDSWFTKQEVSMGLGDDMENWERSAILTKALYGC